MMDLASIVPMRVQTLPIPHGDAGTAITIQQMWRLVEQGKKNPLVREAALRIVQEARVPATNYTGEARAIFHWMLRNIRFTRDIRARETLHSPEEILRLRAGDCDDCTVLALALAQALGAEGRITTISTLPPDQNGPAEFTHVYPSVFAGGRWHALDCAREHPAFGREPRYYTRIQDWPDPAEDTPGAEYLNFYVGRGVTMGTPASRGMQGLRGPRMSSLRSWQTPPQMASRPESAVYSSKPRGMGRLAQDWSALVPSLISTGAGAATEIIAASKGAATSTTPQGGVQTGVAPTAYSYPFGTAAPGVLPSAGSLFSSPLVWLLLLGGVGVLVMSRRG